MDIKVFGSGSKGNCYWVTDGSTPLLIEAGLPFKQIQQKLNFHVSDLGGVLITHEHMDHAKSVKDFMKAGIDCYMTAGTAEALGISGHRLKIIRTKQQIKIGTWTVLPFDVQHDCAEPVGFLLADPAGDKLLYVTDTYYIKYKFKGLTQLMIECNHSYEILNRNVELGLLDPGLRSRLTQSHFSLENVKNFLKANDLSKVRKIYLIHMSDGNSNEKQFKREIAGLTGKPVYIA
jgi:phosphoribosyl 1,2-cyclic phosphodiesterase